jgi:RHS repeat-associated protein
LVKDVIYDPITGRMVSYKQFVPEAGDYLEQKQEFDSKFRLNRIVAEFEQDPEPIVDIEYEYDTVRRLAREEDHISNDVTKYTYDASGRLKSAESQGTANWKTEYLYDGFGNRVIQKNLSGAVPELTVTHDPATNRAVSKAVCYDDNGNIVKLFDMDITYDVENRLVEIERQGKGKEHYAYNPANLRIWKKLSTGEEEIHFYGNGGRRLVTYRLKLDAQGNGDVSLIDYDMYFASKLLRSNSKPVVVDRLGSIHAWIDSQNGVQKTKYYPFGEEREVTKHNRRKFGTYFRDDFSELDYAEQRYYSSALGRFITPDPYEGSVLLGNPETWNRYAYVWNDPINKTDPHGLRVEYPPTGWDQLTTFFKYQTFLNPKASSVPTGVVNYIIQGANSAQATPPPPIARGINGGFEQLQTEEWVHIYPGYSVLVPANSVSGLRVTHSTGGFREYGGEWWRENNNQPNGYIVPGPIVDPRENYLSIDLDVPSGYNNGGTWHIHPDSWVYTEWIIQCEFFEYYLGNEYGVSDADWDGLAPNYGPLNLIYDVEYQMIILYGDFGTYEMPWDAFYYQQRND